MMTDHDTSLIKSKRIVLDPQGGLYYDERIREWRFQKKLIAGIFQADILTSDVASTTHDILRVVGADVFTTRCLRRSNSETGESRQPLYSEGAGQYLKYCRVRPSMREDKDEDRLPQRIWNDGKTGIERDARSRLNFCRHINAELLVVIDISNYANDRGLEIAHNGIGDAAEIGNSVISEVYKRTVRKAVPVRGLYDDEAEYGKMPMPVVILNCGSTFDPFTAKLLTKQRYLKNIGLGLFAGLWKHYVLRHGAAVQAVMPLKGSD